MLGDIRISEEGGGRILKYSGASYYKGGIYIVKYNNFFWF